MHKWIKVVFWAMGWPVTCMLRRTSRSLSAGPYRSSSSSYSYSFNRDKSVVLSKSSYSKSLWTQTQTREMTKGYRETTRTNPRWWVSPHTLWRWDLKSRWKRTSPHTGRWSQTPQTPQPHVSLVFSPPETRCKYAWHVQNVEAICHTR